MRMPESTDPPVASLTIGDLRPLAEGLSEDYIQRWYQQCLADPTTMALAVAAVAAVAKRKAAPSRT